MVSARRPQSCWKLRRMPQQRLLSRRVLPSRSTIRPLSPIGTWAAWASRASRSATPSTCLAPAVSCRAFGIGSRCGLRPPRPALLAQCLGPTTADMGRASTTRRWSAMPGNAARTARALAPTTQALAPRATVRLRQASRASALVLRAAARLRLLRSRPPATRSRLRLLLNRLSATRSRLRLSRPTASPPLARQTRAALVLG